MFPCIPDACFACDPESGIKSLNPKSEIRNPQSKIRNPKSFSSLALPGRHPERYPPESMGMKKQTSLSFKR